MQYTFKWGEVVFSVIISLWLLLGLYGGILGFTTLEISENKRLGEIEVSKTKPDNKSNYVMSSIGISFKNKYFLSAFKQEAKLEKIFPFYKNIPNSIQFLMTACAFGLLGACTRIFKLVALDKQPLHEIKIFATPLLGVMTGFIMLGLSSLIPQLLTTGEDTLKPISVVFLCFFAGLFSKRFFGWLSNNIGRLFGEKSKPEEARSNN